VGYGKKVYLKKQYGDGGVKMMERVKRGIDPFNIMNPQKIVDV
jgi:D-lactate dehydrogenase (cytochrome)